MIKETDKSVASMTRDGGRGEGGERKGKERKMQMAGIRNNKDGMVSDLTKNKK